MIALVKPYIAPVDEMMPAIEKILYSGYIAESEPVWDFQKQFGDFIGNPNILVVNSGTAALHIAMLVLNIGPGDEVISTPMTSEPTNTTIALTGAKIVWADVVELQHRGYNLWIDEANLDMTKDSWEEDALKAIESSNCVLLAFYVSRNSLTSEACLNEIETTKGELTIKYKKQ